MPCRVFRDGSYKYPHAASTRPAYKKRSNRENIFTGAETSPLKKPVSSLPNRRRSLQLPRDSQVGRENRRRRPDRVPCLRASRRHAQSATTREALAGVPQMDTSRSRSATRLPRGPLLLLLLAGTCVVSVCRSKGSDRCFCKVRQKDVLSAGVHSKNVRLSWHFDRERLVLVGERMSSSDGGNLIHTLFSFFYRYVRHG